MRHNGVSIKGTGSYLPDKVRPNKEIEEGTNTTATWIKDRLGIEERRTVENQTVSDLATLAAKSALQSARLDKEEIDMIIVATSSPEKISPATACTVHKNLDIKKNRPCLDLNAVCAGFVFALHMAAPLISCGTYKNVMIIGSETYSKITDWSHRNCVFFGDGAGALVLGESKKGWVTSQINSNGSGTGSTGFTCPLDGKYTTNPREVWDAATSLLPGSIESILKVSGVSKEDVDIFIPHQASVHMLLNIAKQVGLDEKKLKKVMHKYANIAGASIPIALDDAFSRGEVKAGNKILLSAIGSGWSWGSVVINYE